MTLPPPSLLLPFPLRFTSAAAAKDYVDSIVTVTDDCQSNVTVATSDPQVRVLAWLPVSV